MKLVRFWQEGIERPGLVDNDGEVRSLASIVDDIGTEQISPEGLARLAAVDIAGLPLVKGEIRYSVPVATSRKFIAIGLNFADHAAESNLAIPAEPVVFTKAITCLQGANELVMLPRGAEKGDWEVELGVVIGTAISYVDEAEVMRHVAGYCVVNDVSERAYQLERGGTWDKGKGCDTFGPVGPWLVTADEVGDPQDLDMWLDLNGTRMQTGNSRTMIFGVAKILSYLSEFMTLEPGDIVTTGTPPGVGLAQKPPRYLRPGDEMRLGIEKLGEQRQQVIGWHPKR